MKVRLSAKEIMFKQTLLSAAVTALLAVTPPASAQKLYKVIDDKGNVSYQDKPPVEAKSGEVQEKHIDRNVMKLREKAPKDGARTFEEVAEPDPTTFVEEEHRGGPLPASEGELDQEGIGSEGGEIPVQYREAARMERERSSQPTEEEIGKPAPAKPSSAVKRKKKRSLSADELNDIARNAGN